MPELPEVEILVRHLAPLLEGRKVLAVHVHRAKVLAPTSMPEFTRALLGAKFCGLARRGSIFSSSCASQNEQSRGEWWAISA
jgi:formamidopyrimidine-DNA glycosylase